MPLSSYQFGEFELNRDRFELCRNGRVLRLERIPMELLILLAEKDGNVVSRQEIVERLWGKDVFLDTEHGINTAIRKIRTVLHEDAERPRFIQTVLGKGYRFVADTRTGNGSPDPAPVVIGAPVVPTVPTEAIPAKPSYWWALSVSALALCLCAGVALGLNTGGIRDRLFPSRQRTQIRSIAVLPFVNLSGDPTQDYFADGLTDELITMLARNTPLRVVSRTSAMQYKGVQRPLRDIARELGVDGVLEGSVERSATRVHMTVQLIHAATDNHVWAQSYDRDLSAVISLPSELSQTVAREVKIAVSLPSPVRYIAPEAHDAYFHGRYFWFAGDSKSSQRYFEKAIQLQPDYAAAWSGLADAYALPVVDRDVAPQEIMAKAEAAATKALELDDSLPETHNTMAAIYFFGRWDLKRADAESVRAISLNPNLAEPRHVRAYILLAMNRVAEAIQEQKRATELDPFSRPWAMGRIYYYARHFDDAMREFRLRLEGTPRDPDLHFSLAQVYRDTGMWKEFVNELEAGYNLSGDQKSAATIRYYFDHGGIKALTRWQLHQDKTSARKRYVSPYNLARSCALAGRKEEALKYLEDAYREHSPVLALLQYEPELDSLHSEARYRALFAKIGLPPLE